jgi:hypothetical protein
MLIKLKIGNIHILKCSVFHIVVFIGLVSRTLYLFNLKSQFLSQQIHLLSWLKCFPDSSSVLPENWGPAVASWLWHYATSRNVAGSRPDEVHFFKIT